MQADITSNANVVAAEMLAHGMKAGAAAVGVTRTYGQLLLANVRRRASLPRTGPPGPRIQSGNYVRSMNLRTSMSAGGPVAAVSTNAPQARRLEHGFVGRDSLGRMYHAQAYPHWGPALDEIGPLYLAALAKIADP